jgi:hypothetical protein
MAGERWLQNTFSARSTPLHRGLNAGCVTRSLFMNPHIKSFIANVLVAVLPTLLLVATTAFISIPYSLGHHPGDLPGQGAVTLRHLT